MFHSDLESEHDSRKLLEWAIDKGKNEQTYWTLHDWHLQIILFNLDNVTAVETLIRYDANLVNSRDPAFNWTPLHSASAGGKLFKIFVVKFKNKITIKMHRPFFLLGHFFTADVLIRNGAEIDALTSINATPLYLGVLMSNLIKFPFIKIKKKLYCQHLVTQKHILPLFFQFSHYLNACFDVYHFYLYVWLLFWACNVEI